MVRCVWLGSKPIILACSASEAFSKRFHMPGIIFIAWELGEEGRESREGPDNFLFPSQSIEDMRKEMNDHEKDVLIRT